ncbi:unnamed protein product [Anisakis simplex]|uniref:Epidermal differentiation protein n=1 Tax=Anisakis simplex TaxID=6269 RepID=A0A0M3K510_ANISI|nr:unnamed protein product [Anisakis simplex]
MGEMDSLLCRGSGQSGESRATYDPYYYDRHGLRHHGHHHYYYPGWHYDYHHHGHNGCRRSWMSRENARCHEFGCCDVDD